MIILGGMLPLGTASCPTTGKLARPVAAGTAPTMGAGAAAVVIPTMVPAATEGT